MRPIHFFHAFFPTSSTVLPIMPRKLLVLQTGSSSIASWSAALTVSCVVSYIFCAFFMCCCADRLHLKRRATLGTCMSSVQATLRRNPAPDLRQDATAMAQLRGGLSFEEGQHVLFLGTAHYGCLARILPAQYAGLNQQVGGWC